MKVSIATTNRSNFVVGGMAIPDSPYDGHTLAISLPRNPPTQFGGEDTTTIKQML